MKIIQFDYNLTTVMKHFDFAWFHAPVLFGLLDELHSQENLTAQDEEPKVPVVIIERLRLPGGFGGAPKNIPTG